MLADLLTVCLGKVVGVIITLAAGLSWLVTDGLEMFFLVLLLAIIIGAFLVAVFA
jgi:hypothetical protein